MDFFSHRPKRKREKVIDTPRALKALSRKMKYLEEFAFDTETNGLRAYGPCKDFRAVGISISWGAYNNYYIPLNHLRDEDIDRNIPLDALQKYLKPIFEREDIRLIGSHINFDMHVLDRLGIHVKTKDLFDDQIASWITDENLPNGLKENSKQKLHIQQEHFKEVTGSVPSDVKIRFGLKANSKATFDLVCIDDGYSYAIDDSFYTWELYKGYLDYLEAEGMDKIYKKVYVPLITTVYHMESTGASVDTVHLKEMGVDMQKDLDRLMYELIEIAQVEFSPTSSQQVSQLLFGYTSPYKPLKLEKQPKIVQKMVSEGDTVSLDKRGLILVPEDSSELAEDVKTNPHYEFPNPTTISSMNGRFYLCKKTGSDAIQKHSFNFHVISKTDAGAPQTNSDTLWKLSHMSFKAKRKQEGIELCKKLLEFKKLAKLKSAFVDGLTEQLYDDGKVHPSFNITGTTSGRFSCSSPNLQQLPKAEEDDKYQIRSLFIGSKYLVNKKTGKVLRDYTGGMIPPNCEVKRKRIVTLDFKNLEMRVLAHFSEDKHLLEMFESGADTHGYTACTMFNLDCTPEEVKKLYPHLRQAGKVLNFLLMYGGSAASLYVQLKENHESPVDLGAPEYLKMYHAKDGIEVAQCFIDKYFAAFSGVAKFIQNQHRFAHRHGYVYTILGRKRRLPDINSHNYGDVSYSERLSVNQCIQGSAADLTISAQNRVDADDWFYPHLAYMMLQVHDELVFECPEEYEEECIKRIDRYMSHPFGDNVELNLSMCADPGSGWSYQEAK